MQPATQVPRQEQGRLPQEKGSLVKEIGVLLSIE